MENLKSMGRHLLQKNKSSMQNLTPSLSASSENSLELPSLETATADMKSLSTAHEAFDKRMGLLGEEVVEEEEEEEEVVVEEEDEDEEEEETEETEEGEATEKVDKEKRGHGKKKHKRQGQQQATVLSAPKLCPLSPRSAIALILASNRQAMNKYAHKHASDATQAPSSQSNNEYDYWFDLHWPIDLNLRDDIERNCIQSWEPDMSSFNVTLQSCENSDLVVLVEQWKAIFEQTPSPSFPRTLAVPQSAPPPLPSAKGVPPKKLGDLFGHNISINTLYRNLAIHLRSVVSFLSLLPINHLLQRIQFLLSTKQLQRENQRWEQHVHVESPLSLPLPLQSFHSTNCLFSFFFFFYVLKNKQNKTKQRKCLTTT
ncbi:hypothetical protein RFI_15203 [Reticulomyxa filosa]|uniref:Uncharacterized protein n=1 Tax=Reticulomyxa filosa TaxID=46433 RepID=X6N7J0_RETFI|nr:hypothetical protein RFI_15203 [Reticulomyxa filosa]|eukprot:ETO22001.1 hypothetical protein RFI_15203 [Reticulomyxa filosa]